MVNSNAAAAQFLAVAYEVVAVRQHLARVGLDVPLVTRLGRGESDGGLASHALPFVVILEQRKVHDVGERYLIGVGEFQASAQFVSELAQDERSSYSPGPLL